MTKSAEEEQFMVELSKAYAALATLNASADRLIRRAQINHDLAAKAAEAVAVADEAITVEIDAITAKIDATN